MPIKNWLTDDEITEWFIEMSEGFPDVVGAGPAVAMSRCVREHNFVIYAALRDAITKEQVRVRMASNEGVAAILLGRLDELLTKVDELFPMPKHPEFVP